jgi:hypothetical protein
MPNIDKAFPLTTQDIQHIFPHEIVIKPLPPVLAERLGTIHVTIYLARVC